MNCETVIILFIPQVLFLFLSFDVSSPHSAGGAKSMAENNGDKKGLCSPAADEGPFADR